MGGAEEEKIEIQSQTGFAIPCRQENEEINEKD